MLELSLLQLNVFQATGQLFQLLLSQLESASFLLTDFQVIRFQLSSFNLGELQIGAFQLIAGLIMLNYVLLILLFTFGLSRLSNKLKKHISPQMVPDSTKNRNDPYQYVVSDNISGNIIENFTPDNRTNDEGVPEKIPSPNLLRVSVIIAARNEALNISTCIECLRKQDYPKEMFEVIIINDQSTDSTADIINEHINSVEINLVQLHTSGKGGKKGAIHEGIKIANGEIILTTDADCIVPPHWISSFCERFKNTGAYYITGPVMFLKEDDLFNQLQCLEFNALLASTAGAIGIGMPVMSNGANMGFNKEKIVGNFRNDEFLDNLLNSDLESGDDVFMMQNIKRAHTSSSIAFLDDPSAIVYTHSTRTFPEFIHQRMRWVSKSRGYKDKGVMYTALSTFSFNIVILISLFSNLYLTLILFLAKCTVDSLLITKYCRKYGQKELEWLIPLVEPLIILYTVLIGIIGNFATFDWKGRKVSK